MSDPFSDLKSEFDEAVAAAALFFNNDHNKALRVEAPTIALEFTDSLYIGKEPQGTLFYNAIDDFKMTKHDGASVKHTYMVLQSVAGGKTYCTVEYRRDSDTDCYAKVLFYLQLSTSWLRICTGSWSKLVLGSSIATVEKESASQTITIYADAIGKVGKFNALPDVLKRKGFSAYFTFSVSLTAVKCRLQPSPATSTSRTSLKWETEYLQTTTTIASFSIKMNGPARILLLMYVTPASPSCKAMF
ncbi:hypothetical protein BDZ97DRAFT_1880924 [Flammula alnicola]|nr:hypothetical protein BDZ97DRAFT_1880924 [Flammula alnicola]